MFRFGGCLILEDNELFFNILVDDFVKVGLDMIGKIVKFISD